MGYRVVTETPKRYRVVDDVFPQDVPGAGYRPEAPQQPRDLSGDYEKAAESLRSDMMTGVRASSRNLGKNLGIPGTDIDVNALLELLGARPIGEVRQEYERAGPAAGISRLATDIAATAPVGGGVVSAAKSAGATLPSAFIPATVTKAASIPATGRTLRAATEGGVAGALTGEGGLREKVAIGALGGAAGDRVLRGVMRPVTGFSKINPEAEALLRSEIPVTIGQAMPDTMGGRVIRGIEDKATSIPFVGEAVIAGKRAGQKALNQRAIYEGLPPGMSLPKSANTQPLKALREVGEEFGNRYRSILRQDISQEPAFRPGFMVLYRGGTGTGKGRWYTADRAHAERFGKVQAIEVPVDVANKAARSALIEGSVHYKLPEDYVVKPFAFGLDADAILSRVLPAQAKTGQVTNKVQRKRIKKAMRSDMDIDDATPQQLFDVQSDWRKHAMAMASNPMKTAKDRAEIKAYSEAAEAILDLLETGLPQGAELKALRGPYRNYVNLRHEAEKVKGFGETLTATGIRKAAQRAKNKSLEDLARSAESILPSRVPDSGTAQRAAQIGLTGGAGYGAASGMFDPTTALAAGGVGLGLAAPALIGSFPAGAKYLLGQYPAQQAMARALEKYAAASGGVLAQ